MISLRVLAIALCYVVVVFGMLPSSSDAQLSPSFYTKTCPNVSSIVHEVISNVSKTDPRMLASLIRLHFHDYFVQVCPSLNLTSRKSGFTTHGFNTTYLVALSGAQTISRGRCKFFVDRLYHFCNTGNPDPILNTTYLQTLKSICPNNGPGTILTDLDLTTPDTCDSAYHSNLKIGKGLFQSD
ncbi:peroxidase [Trifolium pratense]|uniref:peroxidase n=1 Tax=Trifolium pratense TaxID=57577 RepID=A0A2K3NU38_TRIPR|nr:peroxidase [Trifolium pratense]